MVGVVTGGLRYFGSIDAGEPDSQDFVYGFHFNGVAVAYADNGFSDCLRDRAAGADRAAED
jgi:hypothetical protein